MFKKKSAVEPSTDTVNEIAEKQEQPEELKPHTAISIVKDGSSYKVVTIDFNLDDAKVVEEYPDRDTVNRAFKIRAARMGILG